MAINRTPVLKRCRQLGLDPVVLGYSSSKKQLHAPAQASPQGIRVRHAAAREAEGQVHLWRSREAVPWLLRARLSAMPGITGENLMRILESRLDNVVFRLGFARTRKEARQIVTHGHIMVNGQRVDIPSYRVRPGDVVCCGPTRPRSCSSSRALSFPTSVSQVPAWLEVDIEKLQGNVLSLPQRATRSIWTSTNSLSSNFTRSN